MPDNNLRPMTAEVDGPTHCQKVDCVIAELSKRGLGPYTVAPPLFRLLWAVGLRVPPPLFLGFWTLTLLMGACFGVLFVPITWLLLMWEGSNLSSTVSVGGSAAAGFVFGLCTAAYYCLTAARLRLPAWKSYQAD